MTSPVIEPSVKSTTDPTLPKEPTSQGNANARASWPLWMRQLPTFNDPKPKDPNYKLLDYERAKAALTATGANVSQSMLDELRHDFDVLEAEVMRLFRANDLQAKIFQNRYRLTQIGFIAFATAATALGSFQALALLAGSKTGVALIAFFEGGIALLVTFLATLSSPKQQLTEWLGYRQRAELLRREFYRYLMRLTPYEGLNQADREQLIAQRAASINKGDLTSEEDR